MKANTIDEVIDYLDSIIGESIDKNKAHGYFAALYRKVTIRVKERLGTGYFTDDARMEHLDVVFANRYLDAYFKHKDGNAITASWNITFDAVADDKLIVLQHLLLGMNAHINLDLGIAAAEVAPENILDLKADFKRINELLAELLDEVQKDLIQIWPLLKYLLNLFNRLDDLLVNFSMETARKGAWTFALELAHTKGSKKDAIDGRDGKIERIATMITKHKRLVRFILGLIRLTERGSIASRITYLKD